MDKTYQQWLDEVQKLRCNEFGIPESIAHRAATFLYCVSADNIKLSAMPTVPVWVKVVIYKSRRVILTFEEHKTVLHYKQLTQGCNTTILKETRIMVYDDADLYLEYVKMMYGDIP